jgi:formylmethanofuran dehydrogenase subunit E
MEFVNMEVVSDELLKRAVEFHGHLGPFLVLGLKAGLLANHLLGKDFFKMTALVSTRPSPPESCFVDGVQFTTGCTMGKGNIKLRRSKNTSVLFLKAGRELRLKLRENVLDSVRNVSEKESQTVALELLKRPSSELFDEEDALTKL